MLVCEDRVKVAGKNCGLEETFHRGREYALGRRLIEDRFRPSNECRGSNHQN